VLDAASSRHKFGEARLQKTAMSLFASNTSVRGYINILLNRGTYEGGDC
jgi:hypothetical protein